MAFKPDTPPSDVEKHHIERYRRAAHAMQSGVKFDMERHQGGLGPSESPKMLRVGVNSALTDVSALARLLVEKGILTREEYLRAVADGMEEEAHRYEALLTEHFGKPVILDWRDM